MNTGNRILKSGYLEKYSKGTFSEKWKRVWVSLYSDSSLFWFKGQNDATSRGNINLNVVCRYLTVGPRCREIPYSPEQLPANTKLDNMIAFPMEPKKKSQWTFLMCSSDQELQEWMTQITSTLPNPPQGQGPPQGHGPPPGQAPGAPAYGSAPHPTAPPGGPHAPIVPQVAPVQRAGPPGPGLGFDALGGGGQPPPYSPYPQAPAGAPAPGYAPPAGYAPPQPGYAPPQPGYAPPQPGYAPPPGGQNYGAPQGQRYPQQPAYPQQAYPQQPQYPRQPYQQGYPPAPSGYHPPPPSGYQPPPSQYAQGHPPAQQGYYQQQRPQGAYAAQPQTQTIIIKEKNKGSGKMAAGLVGGALAGYAAGRVMGGPCYGGYGYGYGPGFGYGCGPGFGWGHGSWSSGSWGSWSSVGSFGSFGSFD